MGGGGGGARGGDVDVDNASDEVGQPHNIVADSFNSAQKGHFYKTFPDEPQPLRRRLTWFTQLNYGAGSMK